MRAETDGECDKRTDVIMTDKFSEIGLTINCRGLSEALELIRAGERAGHRRPTNETPTLAVFWVFKKLPAEEVVTRISATFITLPNYKKLF